MKQYCIETPRLELLTGTYSMVNDILDFNRRNKDFFAEWRIKSLMNIIQKIISGILCIVSKKPDKTIQDSICGCACEKRKRL